MHTHTKSPSGRRARLSWAALACGAALASAAQAQTAAAPVADGRAGVFLFAHGPVSVQAGGMASAVVRGTVVHEGDVVETGPGGRAQLRMVDGAMIDLEPGSTLRLAEYQLAAQPANHRSLLELVRGGLRTLTGVIGQQDQPGYELRVRTVTIGVRGTEYRTELQGEQVLLDVLQGRVALCNPAGCVDVARGESARAPLSGALPARTAAATVPGGAAASAATPGAALPAVPGGTTPGVGAVPVPRVSVDGQPVPVTLLPATPAAPATPAGPSGPAAPALPAAPGQPVAPAAPADPGSPATPTPPAGPTPTTPASPGGPGQPATPAQPGGPGTGATPATPANPGGAGQPATPATPAQPGGPGVPATPANPARPAR